MEMTGIPLDENDLKAKYADEFATAIILTINALKKDTRIESKAKCRQNKTGRN